MRIKFQSGMQWNEIATATQRFLENYFDEGEITLGGINVYFNIYQDGQPAVIVDPDTGEIVEEIMFEKPKKIISKKVKEKKFKRS